MSKEFDAAEAGKDFALAAANGDGLSAARVLEEAGSCNWSSVIREANKAEAHSQLWGQVMPVFTDKYLASSSTVDRLNNTETVGVHLVGYGADGKVVPVASVTDKRCDKK